MICTVKDLVVRLGREADQFESIGCHEAACGVHSCIRVIQDELDSHSAIGNADSHRVEPLERLNARLTDTLALQSLAMQRFDAYRKNHVLSLEKYNQLVKRVSQVKSEIRSLPRCQVCNGAGNTKPLFYVYECDACGGSGVDAANLVELVIMQQSVINGEFELISKLVESLFHCGLSVKDRESVSVAQFYENSKTNVRLD